MNDPIKRVADSIIHTTECRLSRLYGCNVRVSIDFCDHSVATPVDISECVAEVCHTTVEAMRSSSRKREIVEARQIAMKLVNEKLKRGLKEVGQFFGGRDHSTVIHAKQTVEDLCITDKIFRNKYNRCVNMVEVRFIPTE